ncbi:MAG: 30S ribosomal protein S1 [Deltaproteobacteria bacterium]|uniref:Small ribosomal subunit protein bS1 n=1 Tax=Candidatus Zymogenus saltonus TaxID=2844893 RepID=A0A9D8PMD9_9DELT|nr:30S ribosomal protein S1 [Candidatus Zymogenus saltonus]
MMNKEEEGKLPEENLNEIAASAIKEEKKEGKDVDIEKLYEESLQRLKEDEIVKGKVIQVTKDFVLVDVGYKSEGQIPIEEFAEGGKGNVDVQVGDEVDVYIERGENENGMIVLSKEKADQFILWDEIRKACEDDEIVEGKIVGKIKGGLVVDIGVKAFLPGSQIDLHPVRNLDSLLGQTHRFKIVKFNRRRGNIVLSRRALLEQEREEQKKETLKILEEGMILEGVVKNITDYGAFIDLGGIDGLLHITDISWGRVNHPTEQLSIGEKIEVKVLKFDKEKERVSLGMKQITPNPWDKATNKYVPGNRVKGKVVSLTDYGAFIELEEGIEGLVHISEMSWTKNIKSPTQVVSLSDEVETVVLNVDAENKRISLGLKQVEPNPWEIIKEKYSPGTVIKGTVKNVTEFGVFVGTDEGVDGLVHISDISWHKKIKHPAEYYKRGQEVEAVVLNVDPTAERFSLGIKQLTEDPWKTEFAEKYKPGTIVEGNVVSITSFGVFLKLQADIEGLIHVSELAKGRVEDPQKFCKVGETLKAVVINLDSNEKKIGLSLRALIQSEEQGDVSSYIDNQEGRNVVLGDVLKKKFEETNISFSDGEKKSEDKGEEDSEEKEE